MRFLLQGLLVVFVLLIACSETSTGTSSGSSSTECTSWGCKVAVIDGDGFDEDDVDAIRANFLLNSLSSQCSITPERVADMAVVTRSLLRDNFGIEEKVTVVLEAVHGSIRGLGQFDCAEIFGAYTLLRGS